MVSLTSAAAAPHHGGGLGLRRLSRGLRVGWRRRKKTHRTPQMGGSLAEQEEERGGTGRRCGTSSKGESSVLSPRPPGGRRVGQAPGAACPRPRRHPRSAWAQISLLGQGQAGRQELRLRSTPLQAAQDGPEGWEKPLRRLGWTSEFSGQPNPTGARELGSQSCGLGGRGAAAEEGRERGKAITEPSAPLQTRSTWRRGARLTPKACESAAVGLRCPRGCFRARHSQPGRRGGSRSRTFTLRTPRVWGAATARGTARRGGLAAPHTPQSASPALLRPSAAARWAPGPTHSPLHPARACRPAHAHPGPGPAAPQAVPRCLWERKGHKAKEAKRRRRRGRGQGPVDSPGGGAGWTLRGLGRVRGSRVAFGLAPRSRVPCPPLPGLPAPFQCSSFLLPSGPLRSGAGLSPGD